MMPANRCYYRPLVGSGISPVSVSSRSLFLFLSLFRRAISLSLLFSNLLTCLSDRNTVAYP